MQLDELTITLPDKDGGISVETLKKALENALDMLRSIEANLAAGADVKWQVVRVKMQSPLEMTFAPKVRVKGRSRPGLGRRMVKACLQGVEMIQKQARLPQYFSEDTLDAAKKLIKNTEGIAFASNGSGKATLTNQAMKNIEELAQKARLYVDFTSIEGRLEVVSVHDGKSISVWETLTNRRIECRMLEEHFQAAQSLLGHRVRVTGRVSYRNHVPTLIRVEEPVQRLRTVAELPQPKDIGPIDITGDLTSEEHVRRMRDA